MARFLFEPYHLLKKNSILSNYNNTKASSLQMTQFSSDTTYIYIYIICIRLVKSFPSRDVLYLKLVNLACLLTLSSFSEWFIKRRGTINQLPSFYSRLILFQ